MAATSSNQLHTGPTRTGSPGFLTAAGLDTQKIYTCDDLVSGREISFSAAGITDGVLLSGVRYLGSEGHTESMVLRCETGSRRVIQAVHTIERAGQM